MRKYSIDGKMIHPELKRDIIDYILENINTFNLNNLVTENFREYIYDSNGDYLINGKNISDFISVMCDVLTSNINIQVDLVI